MVERSGRCLCGAVSYQFSGEPIAARVCWCKDCQHIASNGTVNAIVNTASLIINGELSEFTNLVESGNHLRRRFCPVCGSHLFANSSARPQYTGVRIGTLDEPSSISPTINIWTKSAPLWACFDGNLDSVEGQAPPPKTAEK
ncbi:MAG: GFA family protein [Pseudomonadota bacterium]|nr:GFA family protein [Pseudomonadota bacterium]